MPWIKSPTSWLHPWACLSSVTCDSQQQGHKPEWPHWFLFSLWDSWDFLVSWQRRNLSVVSDFSWEGRGMWGLGAVRAAGQGTLWEALAVVPASMQTV